MKRLVLICSALGFFIVFQPAQGILADGRSYVWTYEYHTTPKNMAEVEYYLTSKVPDKNDPGVNTWEHWLEFEYGLTDHWDISMYQMWKEDNAESDS